MPIVSPKKLVPLYGSWQVRAPESPELGESVWFRNRPESGGDPSYGLALLGVSLDDGSLACRVRIPKWNPRAGAMVVFRASGQEHYFAAGVGGWDNAYSVLEGFNFRHTRLAGAGQSGSIETDRDYALKVILEGQRLELLVDDVRVIEYRGIDTTTGLGVGLLCLRQTEEVIFSGLTIEGAQPKAFIVMQFSSPYDEVYRDAIQPLVAEVGFEPVRVDDIFEPTIIINDIKNSIAEASVVIAEVSEANPNVYYEVGLSHALEKPTFLLAQKGTKLPFDVGPHRCIFYETTIPGRARLQEALRRSLETRLGLASHPRGNGSTDD
jgi:hypothetical protein